jgi:hypothetical protein
LGGRAQMVVKFLLKRSLRSIVCHIFKIIVLNQIYILFLMQLFNFHVCETLCNGQKY